jgi:hypothetical protein
MSQTTFQSHHGMLLNAYFGGGPQGETRDGIPLGLLSAQAAVSGPDETFFVDEVGTGLIALRSINGYYVCAEGGGGHELVANRVYEGEVGPWEIFKLTILDGAAGAIALQTHSGQYVTAELDGSITAIHAYPEGPGPWETWIVSTPWWETAGGGDGGGLANREPAGPIVLEGRICTDDHGAFLAVGASFFWAPRAWKDHRDRFDANMAWLASQGFTFYRALVTTGGWPDPDPWRDAGAYLPWALEVLPQFLDDAFTRYRLRCSLTLFDGEHQTPTDSDQDAYVAHVCDLLEPRLHTLQDLQMANEYGPTGWMYAKGVERLRRHARTCRERLGPVLPISISSRTTAMAGGTMEQHYAECHALFDGLLPDIVTVTCNHDSRETNTIDGHWRHVRQGWERVIHDAQGRPLEPDASIDDEPMGPRSSVAEEDNPSLIVQKALVSFISGRHQYCYHADSGIWSNLLNPCHSGMGEFVLIGDHPESPIVGAVFQKLLPLLPPEMVMWARLSHHISGHPFAASFERQGDHFTQIWPDELTHHGVVRAFGVGEGVTFIIALTGVRDRFDMRWVDAMEFEIYKCADGELLERITSQGGGAYTIPESVDTDLLVIGRYL